MKEKQDLRELQAWYLITVTKKKHNSKKTSTAPTAKDSGRKEKVETEKSVSVTADTMGGIRMPPDAGGYMLCAFATIFQSRSKFQKQRKYRYHAGLRV